LKGTGFTGCEKSLFAGNVREKHTAGAKAHRLFSAACGTTEVVPCYKISANRRFSGLFRSLFSPYGKL